MFFSNLYSRLLRVLSSARVRATPLTVKDHVTVHGYDTLRHVINNGHMNLAEFLASIGLSGEYQVWVDAPDLDEDGEAAKQARQDFEEIYGVEPLPNDPIDLDDYGRVDLFTIVDHCTDELIGDALFIHNENRWVFEFDLGYMGSSAN